MSWNDQRRASRVAINIILVGFLLLASHLAVAVAEQNETFVIVVPNDGRLRYSVTATSLHSSNINYSLYFKKKTVKTGLLQCLVSATLVDSNTDTIRDLEVNSTRLDLETSAQVFVYVELKEPETASLYSYRVLDVSQVGSDYNILNPHRDTKSAYVCPKTVGHPFTISTFWKENRTHSESYTLNFECRFIDIKGTVNHVHSHSGQFIILQINKLDGINGFVHQEGSSTWKKGNNFIVPVRSENLDLHAKRVLITCPVSMIVEIRCNTSMKPSIVKCSENGQEITLDGLLTNDTTFCQLSSKNREFQVSLVAEWTRAELQTYTQIEPEVRWSSHFFWARPSVGLMGSKTAYAFFIAKSEIFQGITVNGNYLFKKVSFSDEYGMQESVIRGSFIFATHSAHRFQLYVLDILAEEARPLSLMAASQSDTTDSCLNIRDSRSSGIGPNGQFCPEHCIKGSCHYFQNLSDCGECQPGYMAPNCTPCEFGTFGRNCKFRCLKYCPSNNCSSINGDCVRPEDMINVLKKPKNIREQTVIFILIFLLIVAMVILGTFTLGQMRRMTPESVQNAVRSRILAFPTSHGTRTSSKPSVAVDPFVFDPHMLEDSPDGVAIGAFP